MGDQGNGHWKPFGTHQAPDNERQTEYVVTIHRRKHRGSKLFQIGKYECSDVTVVDRHTPLMLNGVWLNQDEKVLELHMPKSTRYG